MAIFVNCVAFLLCWVGSCAVYLASKRQLIVGSPLPKSRAWTIAILCFAVSLFTLSLINHWLAACVILLIIVMTSWITLSLVVPYFPNQRKTLIAGTMFACIVAIFGGIYAL